MSDQTDSGLTRTSITLPKGLKRQVRVKAILQDTNLSQVIQELLTRWIEEDNVSQETGEAGYG